MFYQNRFTERAQQALAKAQEAAGSFGHSYIGSEHLLLGLLREGGGPAAKALAAAGVTDDALVKQIEDLSGRGTPDSTAPQGMTPRTKRIIELSIRAASQMGTGYVGTEHLLLGILNEGQNVALTALANLGVTPQMLVEKLQEALGGAQQGGQPVGSVGGAAHQRSQGAQRRVQRGLQRPGGRLHRGGQALQHPPGPGSAGGRGVQAVCQRLQGLPQRPGLPPGLGRQGFLFKL